MKQSFCILVWLIACFSETHAALLHLEAVDLNELYSLPNNVDSYAQFPGLTNEGAVLHRTFTFPAEAGGAGVSTELFLEHRDGSTTRYAVPYENGIFSEVRLNNRGEVAVTVFPNKSNIDLSTRELWVYSTAGVPSKVNEFIGGMGMENLSYNDAGQIAVSNTDENRAYRFTPGLGWEDLGSLSNDGFAVPRAINNTGAVVGGTSVGASNPVTPFLARTGAEMEEIPVPFGLGRAINDNFVVTGDGGWVWHANEMQLDYIFNNQASGFIRPRDINNAGEIVGLAEGFPGTAFYWDAESGYQIITNILEDPLSWTVTDAYAINDDGWILAAGYEGRGPPTQDSHYAFLLLQPVPEPGVVVLLASAGVLLIRRRRAEALC